MGKIFNIAQTDLNFSGWTLRHPPKKTDDRYIKSFLMRYNASLRDISRASAGGDPYWYPLKESLTMLPIITIFSGQNSIIREKDNSQYGLTNAMYRGLISAANNEFGRESAQEYEEMFKTMSDVIYDNILENIKTKVENFMVIPDENITYYGTLKVSESVRVLNSTKTGQGINYVRSSSNSLSAIYPFYYSLNDRLVFCMMVKKEHVVSFRSNFQKGVIDTDHVEIWIETRFSKTKDRKLLHSYINNTLTKELTDSEFKIVYKDNLMQELVYLPKVELRSFDEIDNFKANAKKTMLEFS